MSQKTARRHRSFALRSTSRLVHAKKYVPPSQRQTWDCAPTMISEALPWQWAMIAHRFDMVPVGTYSPLSFPNRSATYCWSSWTVGSSPITSSPVAAVTAASSIPREGDVTVSLRRSTADNEDADDAADADVAVLLATGRAGRA